MGSFPRGDSVHKISGFDDKLLIHGSSTNHLDGGRLKHIVPLEEKSNYFILESLYREWERGLKDRRPEEGRCDKEMNYCEYDRRREGGKATLGYT